MKENIRGVTVAVHPDTSSLDQWIEIRADRRVKDQTPCIAFKVWDVRDGTSFVRRLETIDIDPMQNLDDRVGRVLQTLIEEETKDLVYSKVESGVRKAATQIAHGPILSD